MIDRPAQLSAFYYRAPTRRSQLRPAKQKASSAPASNRWTHFGARLRPLAASAGAALTLVASGGDQHAANSKSLASTVPFGGQAATSASSRQRAPAPARPAQPARAASAASAPDDDDDDDELDSEALLYKMMQQQNFLMNPSWQQDAPGASVSADAQPARPAASAAPLDGNSKKVIKLLKSYSHIHQVDDSDDQIRGTYTRVSARRAAGHWGAGSVASARQQPAHNGHR